VTDATSPDPEGGNGHSGTRTGPRLPSWRIDDLARLGKLTVDTVRYYLREGLLPPAERSGRHKLYGPEHLQRLERIRALQEKRFSLAAIRALLEEERPGLMEGVFGDDPNVYDFDELVQRADIERGLAERLCDAGFLADPGTVGREAYDGADLDALCAVSTLAQRGIPDDVLVEMATIYADATEAMNERVVELFGGHGGVNWDPDELAAFQELVAEIARDLVPMVDRMIGYAHHRAIQQLTLAAIEEGRIDAQPPASSDRAGD